MVYLGIMIPKYIYVIFCTLKNEIDNLLFVQELLERVFEFKFLLYITEELQKLN